MKDTIYGLAGMIVAVGMLMPGLAFAYDSHDFTTTASTAGTTAYIVGKKNKDDLARAHDFVHSQHVALQREAAQGGGEHVAALVDLLGQDRARFGTWMQSHYGDLYSSTTAQPDLVDRISALRTG